MQSPGDRLGWATTGWPGSVGGKHLHWGASMAQGNGLGTRIALLDSGLCWWLPVFAGANIRGRDFTGEGSLRDPTGHGTANASLLVGQAAQGFGGLVPRAELLFARVLGGNDRAETERAVVGAVRWAVEQGAQILALPFGSNRVSRPLAGALAWATRSGVVVVAAAGNRGPDEIAFPASMDCVLAVTGADDAGRVLPECCSLDCADLAAPGDDICGAGAQGPAKLRGSSPAAVLAAGVEARKRSAAMGEVR